MPRRNPEHALTATWLRCGRALCVITLPLLVAGCPKPDGAGSGSGGGKYITIGTAPTGGTFFVVGNAIQQQLEKHADENPWHKAEANGTKGSQENIRRLAAGEIELGMSNSAISYYAYRGESGWGKKYDIRAVVTIAPNVAMFLTKQGTGIETIADLRGKRVVIGPAGAGFEMFVGPILEEHGLTLADLDKLNAGQSQTVDLLADGSADAVFLGGAFPTSSIVQACSTMDVVFIPFDAAARERLIEKYPFFDPITLPAFDADDPEADESKTYRDLKAPFAGLSVGSMHVITSAAMDDDTIYHVAKTLWENRKRLAEAHGSLNFIREDNAARYSGVPFHPGAEKFYKEIGIWPENDPRRGKN